MRGGWVLPARHDCGAAGGTSLLLLKAVYALKGKFAYTRFHSTLHLGNRNLAGLHLHFVHFSHGFPRDFGVPKCKVE